MTTPEETPAGLPRRNMIGAGLGVLGGVAALTALSAPKAEAAALEAVYFSQDPDRVADSRIGLGTTQSKIVGGQTRTIDVSSFLTLDILFSYSVIINVTVTRTLNAGHLTLWQTGEDFPPTSNVNWWGPGQTLANLAFVGVSPGTGANNGKINVRCEGPGNIGQADFIIDLLGYFRGVALPVRSGNKSSKKSGS